MANNDLSGGLPSELANLTALTSMTLTASRGLTGPLPDRIRELENLTSVLIGATELCAPGDETFQAWVATVSFTGLRCPPVTDSTIDVAMFYTPAARDAEGGTLAGIDRQRDGIVGCP